jgi:hypothetical protein
MRTSRKKLPQVLKHVIRGIPLAGAAATTFLPLTRTGHQFMILIVLVWLQVYFVIELFLSNH